MKPYDELSRSGRIRRMRQVASTALEQYGIHAAHFYLLRQAGNTLFRVVTGDLPDIPKAGDLFKSGQYLLRIHQPGYQEVEAIELELAWLAAMRQEADLPVQEPIAALPLLKEFCSRPVAVWSSSTIRHRLLVRLPTQRDRSTYMWSMSNWMIVFSIIG